MAGNPVQDGAPDFGVSVGLEAKLVLFRTSRRVKADQEGK